ncbi:hypothetical protein [Ottowia caeni]|uniref:hypothetical protein n=1 Tax=Ottowia caeni TaxID=2870339 RepID=UPI001E3B4D8E|nr:hypothetical protein [Ottowia caeni]
MKTPELSKKERLLRRYAEGRPTEFYQFDAFFMTQADSVMPADDDGHCLMGSTVTELRNSDVAVRVQIRAGTDAKAALQMLEKLTQFVRAEVDEAASRAFAPDGERNFYCVQDFSEVPF